MTELNHVDDGTKWCRFLCTDEAFIAEYDIGFGHENSDSLATSETGLGRFGRG